MIRKVFIISFLIVTFRLNAQEAQFSQYFSTGPVLNPALIGTNPNLSFSSNYRRSGNKSSDAFLELLQTSITYPLKKRTSKEFQTGAVGMTFWRENRGFEGVYTAQKILLTGSYAIKLAQLTNQTLIFGLQGGVVQNQINGNNLQWGSQFSQYIGFDGSRSGEVVSSEPIYFPTFNFGVVYSTFDNASYSIRDRSLILGVSVDYLNEPEVAQQGVGIATRSRIYRAFGSSKLLIAPRWAVHPSGYVLYSDGNEQINAGLYFSTLISAPRAFNAVVIQAGSWYRFKDSIILLAGVKLNEITLGMSIDLNTTSFDINQALGNGLPSYEISLTYNLDLSKSASMVSSPIF